MARVVPPDSRSGKDWWTLMSYVLIAALSIALHANTLGGTFVWDDRAAVLTNHVVRPETPLRALLHTDFWGQASLVDTSNHAYRRPTRTDGCAMSNAADIGVIEGCWWPNRQLDDDAREIENIGMYYAWHILLPLR
jgi:hypothetical protein